MSIEVFNRYENKYLMNDETYRLFYQELLNYMIPDEHNQGNDFYSITNLYFDTEDDRMIRSHLMKPKYKEKIRLRAYGIPNKDSKIYVEIKKKIFGLVNKRRTSMLLEDAYQFMLTGNVPEIKNYMNTQVISEISYILERFNLVPKVYIAYDRKGMFSKESRDLRITFDTNIRTRREDVTLESGDHGELLLPKGTWLMEIKAEKTIPLWLVKLLSTYKLYPTSFSKYANEYKKTTRGGELGNTTPPNKIII